MDRFVKLVCFTAGAAVSAGVFAAVVPPAMPEAFEVVGKTDASGVTWRQTGTLATAPSNAVSVLDGALSAQGYGLVHVIETPEDKGRSLVFWTSPDADVLAMLWPLDERRTGMRWGFTPKTPEARTATGGKTATDALPTNSVQSISNNKRTIR